MFIFILSKDEITASSYNFQIMGRDSVSDPSAQTLALTCAEKKKIHYVIHVYGQIWMIVIVILILKTVLVFFQLQKEGRRLEVW